MDDNQKKTNDILRHTRAQIEDHKRAIQIYYAELKIKLPTWLKTLTIGELEAAGGTIDSDIFIPREAVDRIRNNADLYKKKVLVLEKLEEIVQLERARIIEFYKNIKKQIPIELLNKKLIDVTDDEWLVLGIDRSN